jgi:hypothetical protein
MRVLSMLGVVLLSSVIAVGQEGPQEGSGPYFGQAPPGDTPAVFAPGVISKEDRFEQFLLFSPDGLELTFGVTNSDWSEFSLYSMKMEKGRWSVPVAAPFLGSDPSGLTSCRSFGMRTALFTAARPSYPPADIWISKRDDAGWSKPTKLGPPISSGADEFEVAISRKGTLYFSSTREGGQGDIDIYRSRLVDGEYPTVENLGPPINTSSGDDLPYIAPDESYLIFASDRPGGLGHRDLYISFQADGAWTEARNLGAPINSEYWDIYPSVSMDGEYLFFTRRKSWQSTEDSDIYWVSAGFIEQLKKADDPGAR